MVTTTSLGRPFQDLTTLSVKNFFIYKDVSLQPQRRLRGGFCKWSACVRLGCKAGWASGTGQGHLTRKENSQIHFFHRGESGGQEKTLGHEPGVLAAVASPTGDSGASLPIALCTHPKFFTALVPRTQHTGAGHPLWAKDICPLWICPLNLIAGDWADWSRLGDSQQIQFVSLLLKCCAGVAQPVSCCR